MMEPSKLYRRFRTLMVANRGEIAVRVIRTARAMGLRTIAVFSEADRNAMHVAIADEAVLLGHSRARDSYLNIERVIEAARKSGAEAVHPGYGFLSESADFAQACADAGLVFVGPTAAMIRLMGSKSGSKMLMEQAGVPLVPGYHGEAQDEATLAVAADKIGFPILVKASAGGGGRGMRIVRAANELAASVESAKREAKAAFGDDRVLIEKFVENPRHIEVQIIGDSHGNLVSLFERECTLQRRHQKVIEEAPSPTLDAAQREVVCAAARKAAAAVDYVGAGTIEFVSNGKEVFFIEMNTRLQVEHPVTELITGIDLVEWQLRVACGEPLPATSDMSRRGFAIEARLYAEDPAHDYLPSVGRIEHLRWAPAAPGLRQDTGVEEGDEVSSYYDPMLGKIIAWGESRATAIELLRRALGEIEIVGVATNRALLCSVLGDEEFRRGAVATNFLNTRRQQLRFGDAEPAAADLAMAAVWCAARRTDGAALWQDTRGWRPAAAASTVWRFGESVVSVDSPSPELYLVRIKGQELSLRILERDAASLQAECDGEVLRVGVFDAPPALHLWLRGRHVVANLKGTDDALQVVGAAEQGSLLTPLPGTIVAVHVTAGERVARGAPLVTVEAMKMEHTLTAPYEGVVSRLTFGLADRV